LPYIDEITLWCQGEEKNWSRVNQQTAGNKWMKISKKLETYFHNWICVNPQRVEQI